MASMDDTQRQDRRAQLAAWRQQKAAKDRAGENAPEQQLQFEDDGGDDDAQDGEQLKQQQQQQQVVVDSEDSDANADANADVADVAAGDAAAAASPLNLDGFGLPQPPVTTAAAAAAAPTTPKRARWAEAAADESVVEDILRHAGPQTRAMSGGKSRPAQAPAPCTPVAAAGPAGEAPLASVVAPATAPAKRCADASAVTTPFRGSSTPQPRAAVTPADAERAAKLRALAGAWKQRNEALHSKIAAVLATPKGKRAAAAAALVAASSASASAAAASGGATTPDGRAPDAVLGMATPIFSPIVTPGTAAGERSRAELEEALEQVEVELTLLRERHAVLCEQMEEARASGLLVGDGDPDELRATIGQLEVDADRLKTDKLRLERELVEAEHALLGARRDADAARVDAEHANAQRANFEQVADGAKARLATRDAELAETRAALDAATAEVARLKAQARVDADTRRALHDEIQALKGNIRVYARVRPPGHAGGAGAAAASQHHRVAYPSEDELRIDTLKKSNIGKSDQRVSYAFNFNRTFAPDTEQDSVFKEISGLVQSALDGYNVCVFAYGQTGAGKTYTMEGPNANDLDAYSKGVIPRAVEQIFAYAEEQKERGWHYTIECYFLEIYLEELYDLLLTTSDDSRTVARQRLAIQQLRDGTNTIKGITVETVHSPATVYELLRRAANVRATASTAANNRSSRSHSVFQMRLTGKNAESGKETVGVLNLVDLAGSERVAKSGATGAQLAEANAINTSLTTLGNVIRAVAERQTHVPYRNSKLTRILEPYLGGNAKTLMFVNVSPDATDISETLSSLRFAEKVNATEIGRATRQVTGQP